MNNHGNVLRDLLEEARAKLESALAQSIDSDDQIIVGNMREARCLIDTASRALDNLESARLVTGLEQRAERAEKAAQELRAEISRLEGERDNLRNKAETFERIACDKAHEVGRLAASQEAAARSAADKIADLVTSGPQDRADLFAAARNTILFELTALTPEATAPSEEKGSCPCEWTEPCDPRCTCAVPFSSVGCRRCCKYGSDEQRKGMAEIIVAREAPAPEGEEALSKEEALAFIALSDSVRALEEFNRNHRDFHGGIGPSLKADSEEGG